MKHKAAKAILMGVAMLAIGAPQAMGLTIKVFDNTFQNGSGGEFIASGEAGAAFVGYYKTSSANDFENTGNVGDGDPSFQTFCLERSETFEYGKVYTAVLNDGAVAGGSDNGTNGIPNYDPISIGTAFLYSQFASGTLTGYNFTAAGRNASAGLLQNAIWCLEDENNSGCGTVDNLFLARVATEFGSLAAAKADAGVNNYGVKVMNLYDASGGKHQDMLVQTPEPASMLLLGSGLIGLPFLRRKFGKKS